MGSLYSKIIGDKKHFTQDVRLIIPNCHLPLGQESFRPNRKYTDNRIKTTKYNVFTFLFLNLFEQFHRFANVFFLFITLLNWIPAVSAFAREVALLPVLFVLTVTAVKDAFEDFRRYQSDRRINRQQCSVHSAQKGKYVRREWADVRVGDMLHLSCDEVIPADILLLHSSDPSGICFIETSNLDGESNLKQREVVKGYHQSAKFEPTDFTSKIECEVPNNEIYKFNGCIVHSCGRRTPITKDNLLLRGCTLRNTNYAEGIVVYAGHDTKALLNNRGPRYKRSKLERQINRDVIWCVVLLMMLCGGGAIGHGIWLSRLGDLRQNVYIFLSPEEQNPAYQAFITFWSLIILLQVMIPLPMYVTIELVKLGQVYFIQHDLEVYHKQSDKALECRALNITEDLGQIQYVFSDKTGTLTENRMVFQCCSIGGVDYGKNDENGAQMPYPQSTMLPEEFIEFPIHPQLRQEVSTVSFYKSDKYCSLETKRIHDFFILMAVCNTVIVSAQPHQDPTPAAKPPEEVQSGESESPQPDCLPTVSARVPLGNGFPNHLGTDTADHPMKDRSRSSLDSGWSDYGLCYEAESPDELALVKAALAYDCRLVRRSPTTITIWVPVEGEVTFTILNVLHFDADRKCMSVIVQYPGSEDVVLLCKGADSAILANLAMDRDSVAIAGYEDLVKKTDQHTCQYAKMGLRTLCFAKKTISRAEYNTWHAQYVAAQSSFVDRERKVLHAAKSIEKDLTLLGATGIEDSLQEGVPETIRSLREAGMNVWVLTGDKQETAINIAYSCHLIEPSQQEIIINAKTKEECEELVRKHLRKLSALASPRAAQSVRVHGDMQQHAHKRQCALIIDGASLAFALACVSAEFLQLAEQCAAVLCCRATPIQKAEVVRLVKTKLKVLTLAIGDGANDVSMIQTADIGIGISGQEGMQAVMASDFALAQFRYLRRLLLVHGHWCYDRLARISLYMFYKSAAFVFLLFWYQVHNGFSGSTAVDQYYTIFHNLFYTSVPPVIVGVFDQSLPAKVLYNKPHLYRAGPSCKSYQPYSYFMNIMDAVWQSAVVFYTTVTMYDSSTVGMAELGTTAITGCVVCALATIALETKSFMWVTWVSLLFSFAITWLTMILTSVLSITSDPPLNPYGVFFVNVSSPLYWFALILSTLVALLPRLVVRTVKATVDPSSASIERQLYVDRHSDSSRELVDGADLETTVGAVSLVSMGLADRSKSTKSLRQLPRTTHIVADPLVSRSVPFLKSASRITVNPKVMEC